eukprot:comp21766_c0_seq2/m.30866 comp21766_c0_seq2/g.30866  ORF comp21766_c0_seq2/g.30866 comp21766_c0_seq2/m.30866 type:complete len:377 (-) comp21766_c0_seq2:321-1451(-)
MGVLTGMGQDTRQRVAKRLKAVEDGLADINATIKAVGQQAQEAEQRIVGTLTGSMGVQVDTLRAEIHKVATDLPGGIARQSDLGVLEQKMQHRLTLMGWSFVAAVGLSLLAALASAIGLYGWAARHPLSAFVFSLLVVSAVGDLAYREGILTAEHVHQAQLVGVAAWGATCRLLSDVWAATHTLVVRGGDAFMQGAHALREGWTVVSARGRELAVWVGAKTMEVVKVGWHTASDAWVRLHPMVKSVQGKVGEGLGKYVDIVVEGGLDAMQRAGVVVGPYYREAGAWVRENIVPHVKSVCEEVWGVLEPHMPHPQTLREVGMFARHTLLGPAMALVTAMALLVACQGDRRQRRHRGHKVGVKDTDGVQGEKATLVGS